MKNIYFVQVNNVYGIKRKSTYIPYAAGCIEAYCLQNPIIAKEYKFNKIIYRRNDIEELVRGLESPYMVLFSSYVWNIEYNKKTAEAIKKTYPNCFITFGGHSVSTDPEEIRKYKYVDFVTHRFGEESTAGILECLAVGGELSEIPNISFFAPDGTVVTTAYQPQTGTDYPSPYLMGLFDDIMQDDIDFSMLFETNRGCPNSCAYCDWGSLKSKVRLFSMTRVKAEIDWFVDHKIEFVYCTDGNFCLFDRDIEIADYIVQKKEKYGYPKVFRVCFTKNKMDLVFDIGKKLYDHGLDKAQTISFQSMNETVLKNVGRTNIPMSQFRDLIKKYNENNLAVFSELILGLPGETYQSFCRGVAELIENGQHYAINIYPCELLPNSEMGQKSYIEKFGLKSTRVPFKLIHSNLSQNEEFVTEYSVYVTQTSTMPQNDWVRALLFSNYVQALHNLGLLRDTAIYFRYEYGMDYAAFYQELIAYSALTEGTILNSVYRKIESLCGGIVSGEKPLVATCEGLSDIAWGFDELLFLEFYKHLKDFYAEIKVWLFGRFGKSDAADQLLDYQYDIIKKIGTEDVEIYSEYNFYDYFNAIFSNEYILPARKAVLLKVQDHEPVVSLEQFSREVVWYRRNKRATDYTSSHYIITKLEWDTNG